MNLRAFLDQQHSYSPKKAVRMRQNLTAAGPAPMLLPSIPMRSYCLPNTWEQHEREYNKRLQNRHALKVEQDAVARPTAQPERSRTRQTI